MCASKTISFSFVATGGKGKGSATVDGIPDDLWARFVERAAEIMPERGNDAWAAVLSEVIANVGGGGQTHTLILTDIPMAAVDALNETAASVEETADSLVAKMYLFASGNALHVVKMIDEQRQPSHLMMLYGIPQRHWDAWTKLAAMAKETPESMFGLLLQLVENGNAVITEHGEPKTTSQNSNG